MNKLEEIQNKINLLQSELDAIRNNLEPDYKNWVREVPDVDEEYYYPHPYTGGYKVGISEWEDGIEDQARLYFTNRDDCELAVKILNRQRELIGDWKPDWDEESQRKVFIFWHFRKKKPFLNVSDQKTQGAIYTPLAAAETLIEEYGDKLAVILK